ncbi:MAG: hypothetical protein K9J16_04630 [Melioribacteraceae bacterium]|nr:hypothetical protein [Melioribacteraceae bacterium]MCF8355413.1 hypothetical protein [Melioribacteraceae bacterium]MCF8393255.1 hypothetical protein [Melioribacteraceae bacterium]MCF8417556.1 hypothetical protein [Melioribacteraceae bacterium]
MPFNSAAIYGGDLKKNNHLRASAQTGIQIDGFVDEWIKRWMVDVWTKEFADLRISGLAPTSAKASPFVTIYQT